MTELDLERGKMLLERSQASVRGVESPYSDEDAEFLLWVQDNAVALLAAAEERDRLRKVKAFAEHRSNCRYWKGGSIVGECDCGYHEALGLPQSHPTRKAWS